MITVENLSRIYTRRVGGNLFRRGTLVQVPAVQDLSFKITAGERVAFIGPNGAGKTTTLRMLTGLLYPTSGTATVHDLVPWRDRKILARHIGLVFGQRSQLWLDLPVVDTFDSLAVIYDLDLADYRARRDQLVETLKISEFLHQAGRSLSLGQRMRCEIAASLLHRPKILFLDEPTIGLDVEAKAILRDYLRKLNRLEDTTIILTSHDTGDIEDICERVIMIDHGRKLLDQPLARLQQEFDAKRRLIVTTSEKEPAFTIAGVNITDAGPHRLVIDLDTRAQKLADVVGALQNQVGIEDMVIERTSLETIIRELYARGGTM